MNKPLKIILPFALVLFASLFTSEKPQAQEPARTNIAAGAYDVRAFGAKGNGQALDTAAINKAIEAAAAALAASFFAFCRASSW